MIDDPITYSKLLQIHDTLSKTDKRINDLPNVTVPEQVQQTHELVKETQQHLNGVHVERLRELERRQAQDEILKKFLRTWFEDILIEAKAYDHANLGRFIEVYDRCRWLLILGVLNGAGLVVLLIHAFIK